MKADRDLIHRLFVASQSGRDVNLESILGHELSSVPRALSKTNGKLHTTDKAQLQAMLTQEIETPAKLPKGDSKTCLLIDGPALIQAIGKPERAKTFGDWGEVFCHSVVERFGDVYSWIDVVFDRYNESSIKSGTRQKRTDSTQPIRRVIT